MRFRLLILSAFSLMVALSVVSGCGSEEGAKPIPAPATPPPANDSGPPTAATSGLPAKSAK